MGFRSRNARWARVAILDGRLYRPALEARDFEHAERCYRFVADETWASPRPAVGI